MVTRLMSAPSSRQRRVVDVDRLRVLGEEWVLDDESGDAASVLQIFGYQTIGTGATCGLDDQRIPERQRVLLLQRRRGDDQRRVHLYDRPRRIRIYERSRLAAR